MQRWTKEIVDSAYPNTKRVAWVHCLSCVCVGGSPLPNSSSGHSASLFLDLIASCDVPCSTTQYLRIRAKFLPTNMAIESLSKRVIFHQVRYDPLVRAFIFPKTRFHEQLTRQSLHVSLQTARRQVAYQRVDGKVCDDETCAKLLQETQQISRGST